MTKYKKGVLVTLLGFVTVVANHLLSHKNDLHRSSVKIVNRAHNSGGTGIVYESNEHSSNVLTNAHVCKVVSKGGVVVADDGDYQVNSMKISEQSDLCMLTVLADLKGRTDLSSKSPKRYDHVKISGHPGLMPNIISEGHLSGREILPILMGFRPCTEEESKGPNELYCVFFGGMPLIKYYESVLASATIMPGSSGSGMYNSDNEIIGVVFAGSKDFGYAWTVPYEQVKNFVEDERKTLRDTLVDQTLEVKNNPESESIKAAIKPCTTKQLPSAKVAVVCKLVMDSILWFQ